MHVTLFRSMETIVSDFGWMAAKDAIEGLHQEILNELVVEHQRVHKSRY